MFVSLAVPYNLQNVSLLYLEKYLNEILRLNPPLKEDGIYDISTDGQAVLRFRREYNLRFPNKKISVTMIVDNQLYAAIGEMLGPKRLQEEIKTLKDASIAKLLQGLPIVPPPVYSDAMKACDQKIADLFGGKGSRVATSVDLTIQNGNFMGWATDRSDHLYRSGVFHLYTDDKGSDKEVELYVPKGAVFVPSERKTGGEVQDPTNGAWNNDFTFDLNNTKYKGVKIIFVHVAGTYGGDYGGKYLGKEFIDDKNKLIGKENAAKTSIQIGYIGGLGGKSGEGLLYRHCHIVVKRNGVRIDPRKVFC